MVLSGREPRHKPPCQPAVEEESGGLSDYDHGSINGWNEALHTVRDCAADSEPGEFPDCVAGKGASGNLNAGSSSEIRDEFIDEGRSIELAFFAYNQR